MLRCHVYVIVNCTCGHVVPCPSVQFHT